MRRISDDRSVATSFLGVQLGRFLAEARRYLQGIAETMTPQISPAAFSILQWVHAHGPARASDIAEGLAMDRSALSRLARQLENQGFIETEAAKSDGRGVVLMLTPSATASIAEALRCKAVAFESRLAAWSSADIARLAELLERLNGSTSEG